MLIITASVFWFHRSHAMAIAYIDINLFASLRCVSVLCRERVIGLQM